MNRVVIGRCLLVLAATLGGCAAADHDHSATTQPAVATDIDPARADPDFWLAQEPTVSVVGRNFDQLWNAAIDVSNGYLFPIDRRDRRQGLLTTVPTISAQWFEPWRRELSTAEDVVDSSVATLRRTIFWTFTREGESFRVVPKVLIERQSLTEIPISGILSRGYFRRVPTEKVYGNRELDRGLLLPDSYYYPVGRDFAFEQRLVEKMQARVTAVAAR